MDTQLLIDEDKSLVFMVNSIMNIFIGVLHYSPYPSCKSIVFIMAEQTISTLKYVKSCLLKHWLLTNSSLL